VRREEPHWYHQGQNSEREGLRNEPFCLLLLVLLRNLLYRAGVRRRGTKLCLKRLKLRASTPGGIACAKKLLHIRTNSSQLAEDSGG
jgi:hypothetical protein